MTRYKDVQHIIIGTSFKNLWAVFFLLGGNIEPSIKRTQGYSQFVQSQIA